jgi:hypothetical protein
MQAFSRLQRSFISKRYLNYFLLILLFILDNISSIYLYTPQFIGIYFLIFINMYKDSTVDNYYIVLYVLLIFFVESNRDFLVSSLLLFYLFSHSIILPLINQYVSCGNCKRFIYVVYSYIGYYILSVVIQIIFVKSTFDVNILLFFYYILLDLVIVGLFYED